MTFLHSTPAALLVGISFAPTLGFAAPTLTKLVDFNNTRPLQSPNPMNVNDSPVLIGNKLWFTCEKGGADLVGSLSNYDIATNQVSVVLSFDNVTGHAPKATPTVDGDLFYITTVGSAGGSIYSTLFSFNHTTNTYGSLLWEATGSATTHARAPWGGVTVIDRGVNGKDLYFNNYSGGTPATGAIQRYQSDTNTTTLIYNFPDSPGGKGPYKGFTKVGNSLYFTTFNGGNGLGTLGKLDVTTRGAETVTTLAAMPTGNGDNSSQLPSHNPYYRAVDNSLYFTTVGSNIQPGALMKYNLTTNTLTFLHRIQGGPTGSHYPEGHRPYGPVSEYNNELYYTTAYGGANVATGNGAGGTINKYNLKTGVHETLFSLDAGGASNTGNDGPGGEPRGGLVYNENPAQPAFFLITKQGGLYDHGTILRVNLDPVLPSSAYETWLASNPELPESALAPDLDPDGDGRPNKVEFAFGTSPVHGADGNGYSMVSGESGMELRWTARTDGSMSYSAVSSATLGDVNAPWTPILAQPEVMAIPDIVVPSGYERRRVILPLDLANNFFRIEATYNSTALP